MKPEPPDWCTEFGYTAFTPAGHISGRGQFNSAWHDKDPAEKFFKCPYGSPGDKLWVRETWHDDCALPDCLSDQERREYIYYRADGEASEQFEDYMELRWRPSIHMPRWASRITLKIVSVRVERLQSITAEDCIAEGIDYEKHRCGCERCAMTSQICPATQSSLIEAYAHRWDHLYARRGYGWDANPWVWVIKFRRAE